MVSAYHFISIHFRLATTNYKPHRGQNITKVSITETLDYIH